MSRRTFLAAALAMAVAACGQAPDAERDVAGTQSTTPAPSAVPPAAVPAPAASTDDASATAALPTVLVHKSPTCGCCAAWVEHLRQSGFTVQVNETDELDPIRQRLGVPLDKRSCHTAEVGSYFVEGHVPAEDIKRLLKQGSDSRGLVLPGMPIGSPGMEVPDGRVERYTVERVDAQGALHPFATHGGSRRGR
jgi:hypothetical protein